MSAADPNDMLRLISLLAIAVLATSWWPVACGGTAIVFGSYVLYRSRGL